MKTIAKMMNNCTNITTKMSVQRPMTALLLTLFSAWALVACGESSASDSGGKGASMSTDTSAGDFGNASYDDGEYPGAAKDTSAPDEVDPYVEVPEEEFAFHSAAVGERYVFIVDTFRDQVIYVDSESLKIRAVKVGDSPVLVQAFPGTDTVIVLNEGSQTASLLRVADGEAEVMHFEVLPGVNTVVTSPYGPYAVLYYDHHGGDTSLGALNAVSILRATPGQESLIELGTGFKPSSVAFREDGERLFVVSQAGLTVVALPEDIDTPSFHPPLPLVSDPLLNQYEREVHVTRDGRFAVTRLIGQAQISVLDLESADVRMFDTISETGASIFASDLDLIPGSGRFVMTFRDAGRVRLVDIEAFMAGADDDGAGGGAAAEDEPDAAGDGYESEAASEEIIEEAVEETSSEPVEETVEETVEASAPDLIPLPAGVTELLTDGVTLGLCRVADDGNTAVFFSTALGARSIGLLDLSETDPALRFVPLHKEVRIVEIDPSSRFGVLYHQASGLAPNPGDDFETLIEKSNGYSVLDIASSYVQPFITKNEPKDLVFLPDYDRMLVLLPDPAELDHRVEVVDFVRFLATNHPLYARPLSIQAFKGEARAVILEEHVSGRLTLVDAVNDQTESVTGFHLNAEQN